MSSTSTSKRPGELRGEETRFCSWGVFVRCALALCLWHPDLIHAHDVHNRHLNADAE